MQLKSSPCTVRLAPQNPEGSSGVSTYSTALRGPHPTCPAPHVPHAPPDPESLASSVSKQVPTQHLPRAPRASLGNRHLVSQSLKHAGAAPSAGSRGRSLARATSADPLREATAAVSIPVLREQSLAPSSRLRRAGVTAATVGQDGDRDGPQSEGSDRGDARSSGISETSTCTPILDLTTQSTLFQRAKNLTAWKKIFNRIAVLNSKISKKRKAY